MKKQILEGILEGNARGYAFLIVNGADDYFIPHSDLKGANHGDTVLCETTDGVGDRTTARVLKIVKRGINEIVGTYFSLRTGGRVVPDNSKYFVDVFIPQGKGVRAKSGDKVVCKILSYPNRKNPEGIISKVLGRQFDKNAEIKSILYSYKLPEKFPQKVLEECELLSSEIDKTELKDRTDLRDELTFTIDGSDARDFDDAVSIVKTKKGYRLGVHIADVSHYVKEGSFTDAEALSRGTSVYFPEKVIPMLPEKLCNDLCSLVENKDRLTLSCILEFDKNGNLLDKTICRSVIKSKKRFTYFSVQKILDGDESETASNLEFVKSIFLMRDLAELLSIKREEKGSIDLEVQESVISVQSNGEISVEPSSQDTAHKIIEEFMISANCAVAEYFYYLQIPFIYRVHGKPTEERLENFYAFLDGVGIKYKRRKDEIFSKDFQTILHKSINTPVYNIINKVMLRTMQKAKYDTEESGHFGLSEKFYCHFTSPIRRYPDLAIHRIIKSFLSGFYGDLSVKYGKFVQEASTLSSEREKIAMEAERAVDDFYKILYISNFEGEEFEGVISGVMNFGVFVELYNGIEGLCKIENLKGRRFNLDQSRYTLSNGKTSYRLGETVRVKVLGVNIIDKKAEFIIVDKVLR